MADPLFESIVARVDGEESSGLNQSAFVGTQKNPDDLASAMKLGKRTGVPTDIAADPVLKPGLERDDRLASVQQRLQDLAPKTRQWLLSDPEHVALAQDDLSTLHGVQAHFSAPQMGLSQGAWDALQEDRIRVQQERATKSEGSSFLSNVNSALTALPGLGYRVLGTALAYPEAAVRALGDVTVNYQNQDLSALASRIAGEFTGAMGGGTVSGGLNELPGKAQATIQAPRIEGPAPVLVDRQTGKPFANPDYTMWGRSFGNTLEAMPGQLATFVGGGALTPAFMSLESALGKQEAALAEMQAQHPNVPLTLEEHAKALTEGLGSGALNYAIMGKMPKPAPAQSIAGVVTQAAGRAALLGTGMTVFENELSRLHEPDKNVLEGLPQSLLTMGLWEGIGAYHQIGQVRSNMQLLDGLENLSKSSKLNARMQEKFQEFVKDAATGTGKENIGVSPEAFDTYFQSMGHDPEVIAKALKVPNYMESKLSGADVQIPVEQWVTQIANTHHNESLIRDARFAPDQLTLNEATNAAKNFDEIKKQALEVDAETQKLPEFQTIKDELKARYMAVGETASVAEAYATDGAKVFTTMAARAGLTPGELFAHYAPKIVKGTAPEVGSLEQSAYHGSPYQFNKFSLEHMGKGEGTQAFGWGLYFAKNEDIADFYRRLSTREGSKIFMNGNDLSEGTPAEQMVGDALASREGDVQAAKELFAGNSSLVGKEAFRILNESGNKFDYEGKKGQLYQVEIPDEGSYLLWDKKISEQSPQVQNEISQIVDATYGEGYSKNHLTQDMTGEELYRDLAKYTSPEKASRFLNSLGLSGIKFADGLTRGTADPTYNYVLFDDNSVQIAKTFYQSQGESPRGWFTRNEDGTFTIGKTPEGDFSTFIHEPAHAYLEMFRDLAKQKNASEGLKADGTKILEFLGAKDFGSLTTEQHEKWARANELYAREGKAPSEELRGVFQRFRVWLQGVYRHVEALKVDLNDDVRGVFDRMRATDQEIDSAHSEISAPRLFTSAEEAGWTEKRFRSYAEEKDISVEKAREEVLRRLNEAALRSQTHEWRVEQSEVRSAVTDMVDARPEQEAIRSLRKGTIKMADGTEMPFTLDKESLVKQFGEDRVRELQKKHPNLYRKEGGTLDAEVVAEFLGHDSGESFMQALEGADRRSAAIETETRRIMTERHGDVRYDGTIKDVARLAVENESLARGLRSELEVLRAKAEADTKTRSNSRSARKSVDIPPMKLFRDAATQIIEGRIIHDLDVDSYLNNQRRYSREAFKKNAMGEFKEAAEAKQKELLNHFLYLEGVKAQTEAKKIAAHADSLSKTKAQERIGLARGSYLEQINNLLERFSFKPETRKATEARAIALALFVRDLPEGSESIIDDALLGEGYRKNYKAMTIGELRVVHEALRNIETLARHEREFLNDGKKVLYATAVQEMVKFAETNNKRKALPLDPNALGALAKGRNALQGMDVGLKKLEWVVDHLDGGDINGPWRKYIFTPIAEAQYKERELHQRVEDKLIAAMKAMPKKQRLSMLDATSVPGLGRVTRKFILSAAMNMGNESNQSKMMEGMKWDEAALKSMFSHLNKADWEFVQKTWDHVGELWPDITALQERATGVPPVKVEPKPFTVQTPEGPLDLAGGYYPLAYDPRGSQQGVKQANLPLGQLFETGYVKATTSKGHTIERVKFSAPLIMDFESVTTRHLAGVIKDLSHREAVMSINKLISNQEVRNAVQETLGEEYEKMFQPWLRGVVNDSNHGVDGLNRWDKAALHIRSNVVIAGLGFRVSSVLVQATDWGRATDKVKPRYLGSAILEFSANPAKMIREVRAMSKEMESRPDNLDRDLRAQWQQLMGKRGVSAAAQRFAMKGLSMADAITSVTTWKGAHNQALKSGSSPEQAVAEADRAVRLTLMSGAPKDLVAIQRKKDVGWKLATMFMGDATAIYGILGDVKHKVAKGQDVPTQAARLVFSIMLPAIVAQLVKGRGPQDDEDKLWWATKQGLLTAPSSVPVLRDVVQAMSTGRDYQFSPVAGGLAKVGKAALADWELVTGDENQSGEDAFMKSTDAASILFGLPIGQPLSTLKYVRKVQKGEENPASNWELGKNLVFGPPPKGK